MAFHGLMVVRDEADIIAQTLDHALGWIDSLYVLDVGSTDGTWQIVQDYAARDRRVVPYLHGPMIFQDSLRAMMFDDLRERFRPGDWIVKLDADELYEITPPRFVRERLRAGETAVHLTWYFFRLTSREVADYESGRVDILEDRKRPIEQRRRMYKVVHHFEPRMFKYRRSMRWSEACNWPYNMGFVARERIPIRHYPHRDPLQMQQRFRLRNAMIELKASAGGHWKLDDWRKEVLDLELSPDGSLERTEGQGLTAVTGHVDGALHEWVPGTPLPDVRLYNHLPPATTRLLQRMIHPLLLPALDARRPAFTKGWQPTPIPEQVTEKLRRL